MKSLVLLFVALFFGLCTVKGNTNETSGVSPQEAYSKGKAYFLAQNYSDALTWAKKAADGKYCPAYVLMAEIYDGTPIDDLQTARYYYSLAVSCASKNTRDYWFSCWRLGTFYEKELGNVTKDLNKALYYYQQARAYTISSNYPLFDSEIARVQQLIASTPQTKTDDKTKANNPNSEELQQAGDYDYLYKYAAIGAGDKIRYAEKFTVNGQRKTMAFASGKSNTDIYRVYIIPDGFSDKSKGFPLTPPVVNELRYHDLGPGKEFCSVEIRYDLGKNANGHFVSLYRDERIPDEVANQLIALLVGKSKYKDRTGIKVTETKSAALQPDEKW